ncbi:MAG TPA: SpoIIE family protein phosphatase [Vicinamibacterales bacterium]
MKVECYGASRARDGAHANEDAFWISRPDSTLAAVCDGAGPAQRCAGRVVQLFARQTALRALDLERFPSWTTWLKTIDASLEGGPQTTFVGVAAIEDRLVGACVGDSRACLVNEDGCRPLTDERSPRLGSGEAEPTPIHERLRAHDVVLLMSDGAWKPLSITEIHRLVMTWTLQHLADLPAALLDLASRHGRADDMTVVALRGR